MGTGDGPADPNHAACRSDAPPRQGALAGASQAGRKKCHPWHSESRGGLPINAAWPGPAQSRWRKLPAGTATIRASLGASALAICCMNRLCSMSTVAGAVENDIGNIVKRSLTRKYWNEYSGFFCVCITFADPIAEATFLVNSESAHALTPPMSGRLVKKLFIRSPRPAKDRLYVHRLRQMID